MPVGCCTGYAIRPYLYLYTFSLQFHNPIICSSGRGMKLQPDVRFFFYNISWISLHFEVCVLFILSACISLHLLLESIQRVTSFFICNVRLLQTLVFFGHLLALCQLFHCCLDRVFCRCCELAFVGLATAPIFQLLVKPLRNYNTQHSWLR